MISADAGIELTREVLVAVDNKRISAFAKLNLLDDNNESSWANEILLFTCRPASLELLLVRS